MIFFKKSKDPNIGLLGEQVAQKYLVRRGYKILEKNYKNPSGKRLGEIDIIAKEGNCTVFVEVKSSSFSGAIPEENINRSKIKKIAKIANFYIAKHNLWNSHHRLDAISVIFDKHSGQHRVKHFKDIFL